MKQIIASKQFATAKADIQLAIDSDLIKIGEMEDDDRLLGYRTYFVKDKSGLLHQFPHAKFSENYGDPNGANYKDKIILYPGPKDKE